MDTALLVLGAVAFGVGVVLLVAAPRLSANVSDRASRPDAARRASGPDRMRSLIAAQQASRTRRLYLARRLRVSGIGLVVVGGIAFGIGAVTRSMLA